MLSDVFDCFWLLFWSRSCLKSSGRLLGTPAYDLMLHEIIGGVHDLQIFSWENVLGSSQDPPGSLPVDSQKDMEMLPDKITVKNQQKMSDNILREK